MRLLDRAAWALTFGAEWTRLTTAVGRGLRALGEHQLAVVPGPGGPGYLVDVEQERLLGLVPMEWGEVDDLIRAWQAERDGAVGGSAISGSTAGGGSAGSGSSGGSSGGSARGSSGGWSAEQLLLNPLLGVASRQLAAIDLSGDSAGGGGGVGDGASAGGGAGDLQEMADLEAALAASAAEAPILPLPAVPGAVEALAGGVLSVGDDASVPEQCTICHDEVDVGAAYLRMPCRHMFHDACLRGWLRSGHNCPMCRHPLPHLSRQEAAGGGGVAGGDGALDGGGGAAGSGGALGGGLGPAASAGQASSGGFGPSVADAARGGGGSAARSDAAPLADGLAEMDDDGEGDVLRYILSD